jgi:Rel homology dimerisation domain/Rel homology DNA-binding domain
VTSKNSTSCNEKKVDGTVVIEIDLKPEKDMTVICDCVGILKERNVDVEHRIGKDNNVSLSLSRNKKKSTKCRMVFRTKINEEKDFSEILEVCSFPITCTQPPGVPEISKKSLDSCSVLGGKELFIIGKNFSKDTRVSFVRYDSGTPISENPKKVWEKIVQPDKEYLQQTHLICVIPPYISNETISYPIKTQIYVTSNNKTSEAHNFYYTEISNNIFAPKITSTKVASRTILSEPQAAECCSINLQIPSITPILWKSDHINDSEEKCNESLQLQNVIEQKILNCSVSMINNNDTERFNGSQSVNGFTNVDNSISNSTKNTEKEESPIRQQLVENFINMICTKNGSSSPIRDSLVNGKTITNSNETDTTINTSVHQKILEDQNCDINSSMTNESNVSLISNAVSDATAETQAAVKQIIANHNLMADIVSESSIENPSTIDSMISSSSQQLQDLPFSELITPVLSKKEILNR